MSMLYHLLEAEVHEVKRKVLLFLKRKCNNYDEKTAQTAK